MACGACLQDGHGDTISALVAASCCGSIGDASTDGECKGPFVGPIAFVWPSDVRSKVAEIDTLWDETNAAIKACAALPSVQAQGWATDLAGWKAFVADGVPTFGAGNKLERALGWQCRLRQWQDLLEHTSCVLAGPKAEIPPTATSASDAVSTLKTVAVAGAVIAGVVLVAPIVWEFVGTKVLAKGGRRR